MSDTLVIRLGSPRPEWIVVDPAGAIVAGPAAVGDAPPPPAGRRVALVPARQVLRTRVDVPVKGPAKILQALPFALEDQLADEVDVLQFAAAAREADGRVPVAVVRQALIDAWLDELATAGLSPVALYSEADGLDEVPATAVLLAEADQVILRIPGQDPVVAGPDDAPALVELWLDQRVAGGDDEPPPPANLLAYVAGDDAALAAGLDALRPRLQSCDLRQLVGGALPRLAAGIVTRPGVNLLQGTYAPRHDLGLSWTRWRLAAGLAVAALGALLALTGLEAWRLRREADAVRETVALALRYTFPDAADGADPRAVLDQRLAELAGGGGGAGPGDDFLPTLRLVAEAVRGAGDTRVESLNYRAGVFELQVKAPSAATLDQIQKAVTADGRRTAEIQSANADGDQVQGRLRIATGAAPGARS